MTTKSKTIIIGLDGVPYGLLQTLANEGVMPNTQKLIDNGIFKQMSSSIPEVSSVAWSSIITGKNPAEHGIFGFMDLVPGSYKINFPNYNDLKTPAFWENLEERSVIINVPSTYPVHSMNGAHISGFVSLFLEQSVYPADLVPKLKELDYRLDVDSEKAHESMDDFLDDLRATLEARIKTYEYLWEREDWRTFMLVFTGTDRLMHFLWEAYENKEHKYHEEFLNHFRRVDQAIGDVRGKITDDDLLIMLSDHGFERLDKEIYINYLLQEKEFLKFKPGEEYSLENIDEGSKAFALDPSRIYINLKGKYPGGSVALEDKEKILQELEELFQELEVDNKKVIRDVYRKENIYNGPGLAQAPDLVLVSNSGFDLKANLRATELAGKKIFTGKHTQDSAFLLVNNFSGDNFPEKVSVFDVANIIKRKF